MDTEHDAELKAEQHDALRQGRDLGKRMLDEQFEAEVTARGIAAAQMVAAAREKQVRAQAVIEFINEQAVRYQRHSAMAMVEDYKLAVELFEIDPDAENTGWGPAIREAENYTPPERDRRAAAARLLNPTNGFTAMAENAAIETLRKIRKLVTDTKNYSQLDGPRSISPETIEQILNEGAPW